MNNFKLIVYQIKLQHYPEAGAGAGAGDIWLLLSDVVVKYLGASGGGYWWLFLLTYGL